MEWAHAAADWLQGRHAPRMRHARRTQGDFGRQHTNFLVPRKSAAGLTRLTLACRRAWQSLRVGHTLGLPVLGLVKAECLRQAGSQSLYLGQPGSSLARDTPSSLLVRQRPVWGWSDGEAPRGPVGQLVLPPGAGVCTRQPATKLVTWLTCRAAEQSVGRLIIRLVPLEIN